MFKTLLSMLVLFSCQASAQDRSYNIYFDKDNNETTGCPVPQPDFLTTFPGIDSYIQITTSGSPVTIIGTSYLNCSNGSFDAGSAVVDAAIGFNTSARAHDVVETQISTADLGIQSSVRSKLYISAETVQSTDIVTTNMNGGGIFVGVASAIPALSIFALLILSLAVLFIAKRVMNNKVLAVSIVIIYSGVVWAMVLVIDGQTDDWVGINAVADDPIGDIAGTGNFADITQVFVSLDNDNFTARIDILDVENSGPTITTTNGAAVAENQTAVIDVNSTDPDGDTEGSGLTYTFTGGADDALFTIDTNSGVLTFLTVPDFEAPNDVGADNVHNVQVTVTNSSGLTDVQDLVITVTNVNEAPTITSLNSANVAENQTTAIDVSSSDPEGDIEGAGLTYSFTGGADDGLFAVDVNTGVVTFLSAPDFEVPGDTDGDNDYEVQVAVADSGALTDVQDIVVTVTNDVVDDTSVTFQAASSSTIDEGMALNVVVRLNALAPLTAPLSVDVVDTMGGTATTTDYNAVGTQTITFPIGAIDGTIMNATLTPVNDSNVEDNETVNLQLQNLVGLATIGAQGTHTVTITEDDVATVEFVSASSATIDESSALNVVARLNIPGGGQLDVAVSADAVDTGGGTATSSTDFTAIGTQTLTFAIGSVNAATQNITLTPINDAISEGDETVNLAIQNVTGPPTASLGAQSTHEVTITDDEVSVAFQAASSSTLDESATVLNVVVSLSTPVPLGAPIMVDVVDTGGGSAGSGVDYTAIGTQTLTFPIGSTNGTTMNATLMPLVDTDVENDETVNLQVQNVVGVGSLGTQSTHTVTITEDDVVTVEFVSTSSATVDESTALAVVAQLNVPGGGQLAVAVSADAVDAGGGSATSSTDYTAFGTQTVTFAIGSVNAATQNTTLTPLDDAISEGNETVNLTLQNVVGPAVASIGAQNTHQVTIIDDEASVVFQSASSTTVNEATTLNVVVSLSSPIPLGGPLMVDVVEAGGGSAGSGVDYTVIGTQTLTFPIGSTNGTTMNAMLTPIDDNNIENDETANLQLQNVVGSGSIGAQSTHTVTIIEDDVATVEFVSTMSSSPDEAAVARSIPLRLNIPGGGQLDVPITASVNDLGTGSATNVTDYSLTTAMTGFAVTSTDGMIANVIITPVQDLNTESNETVDLSIMSLTGPPTVTLGTQTTHVFTIIDDENTAPTAVADSYETIGNTGLHATTGVASTPIRHPNNVLFNDTDPEMDVLSVTALGADVTAPFTGMSTLGGDVVMQSNGDFTYYPPAGMISMVDTFSYTVSDGNLTSVGTASITITSDLVYYVDNTAGAGGDGRDNSRFDQLSDVPVASTNTTVYVFQGAGSTSGNLTLGNNQRLIGSGANLEFNVNNTLANPDVLFTATARPTLSGTTTFGSGNTVRDLNYNLNAPALNGSNVGLLTISNIDIAVSGGGASRGIDINNATAGSDVTLGSVSVSGTTQDGIRLQNNSGSFTFSSLNIDNSTTNATGLLASNTGNLIINTDNDEQGGAINSGTGRAVDIDNTALDVSLTSVSSLNGTVPGIDLNTTTGNFTVTGRASIAESGGTIQNKTGANGSAISGIGILLNAASNVHLSNMQLNNFDNFAIQGTDVIGFSMTDSVINGVNGNSDASNEGSIGFNNLSGNAAFLGSSISGGLEDNIKITNTMGILTFTMDDSAADDMVIGLNSTVNGNDGILIETQNSATANITIENTFFLGARGDLFQSNAVDNSSMDVILQNNTFTNTHTNTASGGGGVTLGGSTDGVINYTIRGTASIPPLSQVFTGARGHALAVNYTGGSTVSGLIQNNQIGTSGVMGSGTLEATGIFIGSNGTSFAAVTINNNDLFGIGNAVTGDSGIFLSAQSASRLDATITANVVQQFGSGFTILAGMFLEVGSGGGSFLCTDIRNNIFNTTGSLAIADIYYDFIPASGTHNSPGYAGGPNNNGSLLTYFQSRGNTLGNTGFEVDNSGLTIHTGTGTTCP